jgi:hypothetical protein
LKKALGALKSSKEKNAPMKKNRNKKMNNNIIGDSIHSSPLIKK